MNIPDELARRLCNAVEVILDNEETIREFYTPGNEEHEEHMKALEDLYLILAGFKKGG